MRATDYDDPSGGDFATECTEAAENPFKFTGQWFDSEIEQYYLRARMYDPGLMRFTGRDPVRGKHKEPLTLHKYLYCNNDPLNHIDPSGELFTETLITTYDNLNRSSKALVKGGIAAAFAGYLIAVNNMRQFGIGLAMAEGIEDAGIALCTVVAEKATELAHAISDHLRGGKQKYRDSDLWQYKDSFKGDPDRWRKFRDFIHRAKKGRADFSKEELAELFEEFINSGY